MPFALNSRITIGKFRFSGVYEVRVKRGLHSISDTGIIKIPSIGVVKYKNGDVQRGITSSRFNEGDAVKIELGYNGRLKTEFEGFLKRMNLNTPLELECEGYVRQLRLNNTKNAYYAHTTAKDLLQVAVAGTDITVDCPDNIPLSDIRLINASGADICEHIKKSAEGALSIFFKEPKVLYCGLTYTGIAKDTSGLHVGDVKIRLGYNVLKDNGLKEHNATDPVQVILKGKLPTGEHVFSASQLKNAAAKLRRTIKHLPDAEYIKKIAQEIEWRKNYKGYEGTVTAFLEPFCLPGYRVYITDSRYKQRDGTYMCESTEVTFGTSGARRIIEIGPKVGFAN